MTSLADLQNMGGVAAAQPIKQTIKFMIDDVEYEAEIHVRDVGIAEYERVYINESDSQAAKLISETITLGEDGTERITLEDASRLKPALAGAMIDAFNRVNLQKKT